MKKKFHTPNVKKRGGEGGVVGTAKYDFKSRGMYPVEQQVLFFNDNFRKEHNILKLLAPLESLNKYLTLSRKVYLLCLKHKKGL